MYHFFLFTYLFAPGLSCGMHVGSSSLIRGRTRVPCIESAESYPLRHQGSPIVPFLSSRKFYLKKKKKSAHLGSVLTDVVDLHPYTSSLSYCGSITTSLRMWTTFSELVGSQAHLQLYCLFPKHSPKSLSQFTQLSEVNKNSHCFTSLPTCGIIRLLNFLPIWWVRDSSYYGFILSFPDCW